MRVLILGAGGVGSAMAAIAARRPFFEELVIADIEAARAERAAERAGDGRIRSAEVNATDQTAVLALALHTKADVVVNACDPRCNPAIFGATFDAGATYLDMAMNLSVPHPTDPYTEVGEALGHAQLAAGTQWSERGQLALVGMGVEPGLSDVFARYAADALFTEIDEIGVRDGSDLRVDATSFTPTFSIWTTIEECLNPPLVWERDRGWFTTAPFSEPEVFDFPEGIGPLECVNVEHEEVVLIPRWIDCRRVTFKYGLGAEFIAVLRTLHTLGLDSTRPVQIRGVDISPREVVAACLPDPADLGDRMKGRTCAGTWVSGRGQDGERREVYLYHLVDNAWSMREYGHQAVVWQTAVNPVVALELLAEGTWEGTGVLGPEALPAQPFLERLVVYDAPWAMEERRPGQTGSAGIA